MDQHTLTRRDLAHGGTMRGSAETLLDGLDAILWEMDPEASRFTFVSAGAERVLGYPASRWIEEPGFWRAQLHPADEVRAADSFAQVSEAGPPRELEYRMIAADGRTVWLRDIARCMRDDDGVLLLHGVMLDVTGQKSLERELRASQERFARLSNASVDGVLVHARGRIIDANDAAATMLGYELPDLIGRSPIELTIAAERAALVAHIASESEQPLQGHALMRDGRAFPVEMRARSVETSEGTVRVVIVRDISDRRRAEQEIRAGEVRLRVLLKQMPALFWTTDRDLRSTSFIGRGLEPYGVSDPETAVGLDFRQLLSGQPDQQRILVESHEAALAGRAVTYSVDWDGIRWEAHVEPLRDANGDVQGVIGLAVDISERVRAEAMLRETERQLQQAQKLEAVGRLAGGIAHDFNNLLTVITGFTQMVIEGLPPAHAHVSDLHEVQRAASRAAELTRQLLAFSRRQVLRLVVIDLDVVIADLDRMLRRVIGEQVQLRTAPHAAADGREPRILADRGQIEQVVMNLVVNARDAMPDGGSITVRTTIVDVDESFVAGEGGGEMAPGRYVRLDVTDTGIGMPAAVRAHIFEPFFTTKPVGTGTGLGLPMAYGVVQQSGGHIVVDSEPGRGTTFSLFFPLADEAGPAPERPTPQATSSLRRGAETILLVEDEDAVRDVARRILSTHGYAVLVARHATEAMGIADAHRDEIDLLLTDLVMPGLGGRALADRLRAHEPGLRVLFMTGYTDEPMQHDAHDGALTVLKPFTVESLTEAVRTTLDRGRARRA